MGRRDRFFRRSSWGRLDSTCFPNCGQPPPEITATFTIPSRVLSSVAISASRDSFAFGKRAIQIENDELLHGLCPFRQRKLQQAHCTTRGRHKHAPTTVGKSSTSPLPKSYDAHQHARRSRCTNHKRRCAAESPPSQMFTIKERLSQQRLHFFHHRHRRTHRTLCRINAGNRLIDL